MSDHFPPLYDSRAEESEAIIEAAQADMDALADALLGTEFRDADVVRQLSRLSSLRSPLIVCRRNEDAIEGDDPPAHREMMADVEALLHDAESVLTRLGYMPDPE